MNIAQITGHMLSFNCWLDPKPSNMFETKPFTLILIFINFLLLIYHISILFFLVSLFRFFFNFEVNNNNINLTTMYFNI